MTSLAPSSFDLISPTALTAAYNRQFSNIPYAFELAQLVDAKTVLKQPSGDYLLKIVVPLLEVRYKAAKHLIARFSHTQIIELASGLLPRGLEMSERPNITFVESDLPAMIDLKKQLVTQLVEERSNLHFEAINATIRPSQFPSHADYLRDSEKVTILCEGLLMYLTFPEKERVCANVREVLWHYGGVWITPDLNTKEQWHRMQETNSEVGGMFQTVSDFTGRSLIDNSFNDMEHARQFFREQGFGVEEHKMIEIMGEGEVSCKEQLGLDPNFVKYLLSTNSIFALTLDP
jgi:O-methyltransferase involved in polyketide biosynthesis